MREVFFLPENTKLSEVDVILVTGDAYIDHPSFGVAIIARVLHSAGYTVAIVSQPEYHNPDYLNILPEPRLFIGITSGNIDSTVNNHTGNRHRRDKDSYSIDGNIFFPDGQQIRPDRAVTVYSSFIKRRFKNIPIVIGGIEASLRRFAHYDYVQQKIRRSALLDSKADILVYSMGEKAILEIANRLKDGKDLFGVRGTVVKSSLEKAEEINAVMLPSMDDILDDKSSLVRATKMIEDNMVWDKACSLYQVQGKDVVLSFPPQKDLSTDELDDLYSLPFRKDYPNYCDRVPAWNMIKDSITSHRGCYARCSFCAITSHQGAVVVSRSEKSILNEAKNLSTKKFFKGTISDIGGPTANMYGTHCKIGWCKNPQCLFPTICPNLVITDQYRSILKKVKDLNGVGNVFVSSGIRFDLALRKKEETEWIIRHATSGHFKIAPEHVDDKVLKLMRKPPSECFIRFIKFFDEIKRKFGLNFYMLPYIILSHPGSTSQSVENLANFLIRYDLRTHQYQDFTPTPQTISTAMFYSSTDLLGKSISVPNPASIKNRQRDILENRMRYRSNNNRSIKNPNKEQIKSINNYKRINKRNYKDYRKKKS